MHLDIRMLTNRMLLLLLNIKLLLCLICHAKMDPPYLVPPGPNISKYLDHPDNIF